MSNEPSLHQALRLKKLIEANQALAKVESLDELLPLLLNAAKEVTDAVGASILLYKPESDSLEFTLAINEQLDTAEQIINQKFELKMGEGIAGHVASSREPLIIADAQKDNRFQKRVDKGTGFVTKSILCTPILYQDELLGVIQVLNAKDKPMFDTDDLDILESFTDLASVALIRSRMLEAMLQQERMQAQMDAAARIQANFLPDMPDLGPGRGIYAITQPAIFVGGDFYDVIQMQDESLIVCVADVSGKGLPAALVGASLWTRLRTLAVSAKGPADLLSAVNAAMYSVLNLQLFATMVVCQFWPKTGVSKIALAGHLPPLHVKNGSISYLDSLHGQPIGIDPVADFDELEITLEKGEALMFMTDGVEEARNAERKFFGEERIEMNIQEKTSPPWGRDLVQCVETWRGNIDANDDLTVVEIWRD